MRCKNCDCLIGCEDGGFCDSCKKLVNSSLLENCQDYIDCMGSWGGSGSQERANIHGAIALKLKLRHSDKQLREITDNLDKYLDWSNFELNEFMVKLYGKKLHDLLVEKFDYKGSD